MDLLAHHVRLHLVGAAAGIALFGRELADADARRETGRIRRELVAERRELVAIAESIGASDPILPSFGATVGERLGRLKPNGRLLHRTPLTDVVDLEAMRDAVAGKIGGWEAMLQSSRIDHEVLNRLLGQARRQHDTLGELHAQAASRAFD